MKRLIILMLFVVSSCAKPSYTDISRQYDEQVYKTIASHFADAPEVEFGGLTEAKADEQRTYAETTDVRRQDQNLLVVSANEVGKTGCGPTETIYAKGGMMILKIDTPGCKGAFAHTVTALEGASGRLFPLSEGNTLVLRVRSNATYTGPISFKHVFRVVEKIDTNGAEGDLYKIRETVSRADGSLGYTNEYIYSTALHHPIARYTTFGKIPDGATHVIAVSRPGEPNTVTSERLRTELAKMRPMMTQFAENQVAMINKAANEQLALLATINGFGMMAQGIAGHNPGMMNFGNALVQQGVSSSTTGAPLDYRALLSAATAGTGKHSVSGGNGGSNFTPIAHSASGTDDGARISGICKSQCKPLEDACSSQTNAQSACYRAAACECECFLNNDHRPMTPLIAETHKTWQQCVADNRAQASSLRSR